RRPVLHLEGLPPRRTGVVTRAIRLAARIGWFYARTSRDRRGRHDRPGGDLLLRQGAPMSIRVFLTIAGVTLSAVAAADERPIRLAQSTDTTTSAPTATPL